MTTLKQAIDCARFVRVFGPDQNPILAVWHGGHTVNYYAVVDGDVQATNTQSVGDFAEDEATLEEVKEAIEAEIESAGY